MGAKLSAFDELGSHQLPIVFFKSKMANIIFALMLLLFLMIFSFQFLKKKKREVKIGGGEKGRKIPN